LGPTLDFLRSDHHSGNSLRDISTGLSLADSRGVEDWRNGGEAVRGVNTMHLAELE